MEQIERILEYAQNCIEFSRGENHGWSEKTKEVFKTAIQFTLENLWVYAGDHLPDKDTEVFVISVEYGIITARHDGKDWWAIIYQQRQANELDPDIYYKVIKLDDVTYWMPLPLHIKAELYA